MPETTPAANATATSGGFIPKSYTDYHAKIWAACLTLHGEAGHMDKLARPLSNSRVDLNPHQIESALFAIQSPLSKGVILADEVGLGKTIEAGLVISQRWAEGRRKILLILPSTIRKQWQQELGEKFSIPAIILETKSFKQGNRNDGKNSFDTNHDVVIVSYNFAARRKTEISSVAWDLVIIDEAHRLRNVYKPDSKIAAAIRDATKHATKKLLLTATPLQNSLIELYGLASVVDPNLFGDERSFREQFMVLDDVDDPYAKLRNRLQGFCRRTLRKQVLEYIQFTSREAITQDFSPSDAEQALYEKVSDYLQREDLIALPRAIRRLITMVLRKLLASSTRAIAVTLRGMVKRLEERATELLDENDFETLGELAEEWSDEDRATADVDPVLLEEELNELRDCAALAEQISTNAKGEKLLSALPAAFARAEQLGAARKTVIFTESRRTQAYLFELLTANGYGAEQIVLINGSNGDRRSEEIYQRWLQRHRGTSVTSGSKSADMKGALVEEFRNHASILLATESAAEGVNLQFCSLVVNYDLPWNPQRVEQRIGRCHRYGQKHDVVVLNFLNRRNAADQRVFQLLNAKFRLFQGVFGASDEILGALESGVDFERSIAEIYQQCRMPQEIEQAFDELQAKFEDQITSRLGEARKALLENFDEEIAERLRVHKEEAQRNLTDHQRWLLYLTRHELRGDAEFGDREPRFAYVGNGYHLDWRSAEAKGDNFYNSDHPLARELINRAFERILPVAELVFDYSGYGGKISELESLIGTHGWLEVSELTVESLECEEALIFTGCVVTPGDSRDLTSLEPELCRKLLLLPARVTREIESFDSRDSRNWIARHRSNLESSKISEIEERNGRHFDEEVIKLDGWADDLKGNLEREIQEEDRKIDEARAKAKTSPALTIKLESQKALRNLERQRNLLRRQLYEKQDGIDLQRDELIRQTETRLLNRRQRTSPLFLIRWVIQ